MEGQQPLPPGVLPPDRLADLRRLVEQPGPFASVYLPLEAEQPDASHRLAVRWRDARRELADAGAPDTLLDELGTRLGEPADLEGGARALIGTVGATPVTATLGRTVRHDLARWAPMPVLAPLVASRQAAIAHVVVLTDHTGADVFAVDGEGQALATVVEGDSWPIEHNAPGGWSQPRYHRRAQSSWDENAAEVAEVVVEVADDVDAAFIAVGGDPREVGLVRRHLPRRLDERVHELPGSRHPDGSADEIASDLARTVATAGATVTAQVLRRAREEVDRHGEAVSGADAVLAALAQGQVAVLVTHDDPDDDRTAWFGPQPMQVGATAADVAALGVETPTEGRLLDVAVRAALGSGATVHVVPSAARELSALLRWQS